MEAQTMMQFPNCEALEALGYFRRDENGRMRLASPETIGPIIDFHQHLAFSFAFSPPLDLKRAGGTVRHYFPADTAPVDLSVYSGANLGKTRGGGLFEDIAGLLFKPESRNATHTMPNLLEEMDRTHVERGVLLAMDFVVASKISEQYLDVTAGEPRLVPFVSVNTLLPGWEGRMEMLIERGARGLKVHPYSQWLASDHPQIMKMLKRWAKTKLPVLFHTGFNGFEPAPLRRIARIESYEKALRTFPETPFILGHSGMNYYGTAIDYTRKYGNTYLEVGGQPPAHLTRIFDEVDPARVLFGSDWPFYTIMLPLAKVLIATEGRPETRRRVLYENAAALLQSVGAFPAVRGFDKTAAGNV